jgi:PPOX class probable FMN-dependent enzyme
MRPVENEEDLLSLYPAPGQVSLRKQMKQLDRHCRNFISKSPFVVVGSSGADGRQDVSPRGDAPGFVRILDDRTLALPDRTGNNRLDTLHNLVDHPHVGLLFFIPGVIETLRVNGKAKIVEDPQLRAASAHDGKLPITVLLVSIEEVFLHCGKSLLRSGLWDRDCWVDRGDLPTLGKMMTDQVSMELTAEEAEQIYQEHYRTGLY